MEKCETNDKGMMLASFHRTHCAEVTCVLTVCAVLTEHVCLGVERYNEGVCYKVIHYRWEHLDNISPLPPYVQVVDNGTIEVN